LQAATRVISTYSRMLMLRLKPAGRQAAAPTSELAPVSAFTRLAMQLARDEPEQH